MKSNKIPTFIYSIFPYHFTRLYFLNECAFSNFHLFHLLRPIHCRHLWDFGLKMYSFSFISFPTRYLRYCYYWLTSEEYLNSTIASMICLKYRANFLVFTANSLCDSINVTIMRVVSMIIAIRNCRISINVLIIELFNDTRVKRNFMLYSVPCRNEKI